MFPEPGPRLFALPPGVDFPAELVRGLTTRLAHAPPEDWARVTLIVNTRRMQRRVRDLLAQGPARVLPRMRLVTDFALDPLGIDLPLPVPPLRRRLELARLVAALIAAEPDLAPRAALYDLADSLAALMDEMAGEGVPPEAIARLDVSDQSGHWARAQRFLALVGQWRAQAAGRPDREERQRLAIQHQIAGWSDDPPQDPVIVAGSTGSRGSTALLLAAVAQLPQGAVVLPGYDADLPKAVWQAMVDEGHPQFRFRRLADAVGLSPHGLPGWTAALPPAPQRNRLVSLALRPPPVTDQWLTEGAAFADLRDATQGMTLIEAPSPRAEAEAVALCLRGAVEDGRTAALVTPDRGLTRLVAAALGRWGIVPDDSAGVPLSLTPPGRLLRQVAEAMGAPPNSAALIALWKHPLVAVADRGPHLRWTHEVELHLRRGGLPQVTSQSLAMADQIWRDWAGGFLTALAQPLPPDLPGLVARHLALTEAAVAGPGGDPAPLWDQAAGRAARVVMADLATHAVLGPTMDGRDYAALLTAILRGTEVRDRDTGDPRVLIRGTLEVRVGGADLVVLGGLNDGTWPDLPAPDPWLNRRMRQQAGLLLPERRIGLSAHDFQQAIAAPQVVLTRAMRSDEAPNVPSRWLNRLTNLIAGLTNNGGPEALAVMRARGAAWLAAAASLDRVDPQPKAPRPAPNPPGPARPRRLSVTDLPILFRDPYAIYARRVLRLEVLPPLSPEADARTRGILLHKVLERAFQDRPQEPPPLATLLDMAQQVLAAGCPWPASRALLMADFSRRLTALAQGEADRFARGLPWGVEAKAELMVPGPNIVMVGKADRIDRAPDGAAIIYDYKSGAPPSAKQQARFEKQLLVLAAMAEQGAFDGGRPIQVEGAAFLSVKDGKTVAAPLDEHPPSKVWAELTQVLAAWAAPGRAYVARRAMMQDADVSDYDHLSRYGEWAGWTGWLPQDLP